MTLRKLLPLALLCAAGAALGAPAPAGVGRD